MHSYYIGPHAQRLFATLHPALGANCGVAALLLSSHGREQERSHRLLRVLAQRLAMQGVTAMRIDWQGSGDSAGEDTAASLATWSADAARAHADLQAQSRAARIVWVGLRVGGTVALQADPALARDLVLLDPVLDGAALLAAWQLAHDADRRAGYTPGNPASRRMLAAPSGAAHGEVMGYGISPAFVAELGAVTPDRLAPPAGACVRVVHAEDLPGLAAWQAGPGRAAHIERVAQSLPWLAPEAGGTPPVPTAALNALLAGVRASAVMP